MTHKILKDYKIEKMQSKLRNNYPEHSWLNAMKNFKSNRIKNILLLAICVVEVVIHVILIYYKYKTFVMSEIESTENGWFMNLMHSSSFGINFSINSFVYNEIVAFAFSECVLTFLIRILTQYLVYLYSYYKPYLNLKLELYISITCWVTLILLIHSSIRIYKYIHNLLSIFDLLRAYPMRHCG